MIEKECVYFPDYFNGLERLELFFLTDFVKDCRGEFFILRVFECDLLYSYVLLSDLWLNVESPATEDEICHLNEDLNQALLIEFALFFLKILV